MKPRVAPARLLEQPALNELMQAGAQADLAPERLERIGRRVQARVAELPERGPLGRWLDGALAGQRLAPATAVLLVLLAAGGVGAALWAGLRSPAPVPPPPPAEIEAPQVVPDGLPPEPWGPDEPPAVPPPDPRLSRPDGSPAGSDLAQLASTPAEPEAPPAESDLPEQLRLYRAAVAAAKQARFDQALSRLDELERRFPATVLKAEVGLSRAEWLYRAGRYARAARVVQALLERPELAGKRAQLTHLLGDLRVRQGRCDLAADAYRRALGLGLPPERAAAARAGLARCAQ